MTQAPCAQADRPVLALVGPTASGKTALALALARHAPIEIVSVDSALVYRGLNIGSAKPTQAERATVPHHLIDVRDPWNPYSAADFATDARRLVAEIQSRSRHPLLVGGTMLYLKALSQGLATLPPADPQVRADLDAQALEKGWPALHQELARVDPATALRLAPGDRQRVQRALEVYRLTGVPLSALQIKPAAAGQPLPVVCLALEPIERAWLHRRIEARLRLMMNAGLLDEVRALRADERITGDLPAMRAVGYRQCWEALEAERPGEPIDMAKLLFCCIAATRQLAKRQLTWLRSWPGRVTVTADEPQALQTVVDRALLHWRS